MIKLLTIVFVAALAPVEREASFTGVGGLELHGTLTMPDSATVPVPAVLLLPGSGPSDRDGNQPPMLKTDLLKQIADDLAARGIASLRFDKRAAHVRRKDWPKDPGDMNEFFTWERFVGDAEAAMRFLRQQEGIDPDRVGIVGHSEGGSIGLQIAADASDDEKPAFLVLLATPGRNYADIIREQISGLLRSQGAPQSVYEQFMADVDRAIRQVRESGTVPEDLPPGLKPLFNPTVAKLLGDYFKLDAPALAKTYPGPVLIVNGEMDAQVSPVEDVKALREAFESRASGDVTVNVVPGASHNLKKVSDRREPGFVGPVVPEALDAIGQFVVQTTATQSDP